MKYYQCEECKELYTEKRDGCMYCCGKLKPITLTTEEKPIIKTNEQKDIRTWIDNDNCLRH